MVVIHIKGGENNEFLIETTCATSNDSLIKNIVEVIIKYINKF